jgi:large subunit ribosomal protein L35
MPKMKTRKGVAKKIKVRNSGTPKIGHPGSRHNLGGKTSKINRRKRNASTLSVADTRRLRDLI